MVNSVREATKICFEHYNCLIDNDSDIKKLIENALENIETYPIDKLNRWLGFVQGYLIFNGFSTVEVERDFTRELFHEAYKNENINIPKTFSTKIKG